MTEENYKYRTSPFLLRNQFEGMGKWQIPVVPKFQSREDDFTSLRLIGFDKTSLENSNHLDRMVHFFLYDYKFERVWKNPDSDLEKLRRYRAVLTPDFSMYTEMAPVIQLYNTFRNRWCGAYYASKGLRVISTVSWGDEDTFGFCFEGIEKGSVVAVSTYMVSARNNHSDQKDFFLKGYNEMLRKIEPEKIICYNEPFPEMRGDIVFVDYDLSSWRYMNDDPCVPSKYVKYICGLEPLPPNSGIVIKSGYVINDPFYTKGMGSAEGGGWRPSPNKPQDERFLGKPGEKKTVYNRRGEKIETKIGPDGKAEIERHYSDHRTPNSHTNPHDHEIDWANGYPHPGPPINYPVDVPEFKRYIKVNDMSKSVNFDLLDDSLNFETISDFKWCMKAGGEVEFAWEDKIYCAFGKLKRSLKSELQMCICEANKPETEKWYDNADDALEYDIDSMRLRDIITKVKVIDRTI